LSRPDEVEDLVVHHGCLFEYALAVLAWWGDVVQVAVEEQAQDVLWDPREDRFGTEHIHSEQRIDERVARYDPFLGAGEDVGMFCLLGCNEFECFHGGCAATDDGDFLALCLLAV
jgi:hypothetical protein